MQNSKLQMRTDSISFQEEIAIEELIEMRIPHSLNYAFQRNPENITTLCRMYL